MNDQNKNEKNGKPILVVPFMWIGDYVRCQSVYMALEKRFPDRPIDVLSTRLCAPLAGLMPQLRKPLIVDFKRGRLSLADRRALANRLREEHYGDVLLMTGTFKDALAPWLAGIPHRTGWLGEMRFGLVNDIRFGERQYDHLADRCLALALPRGTQVPDQYDAPSFAISDGMKRDYRKAHGLDKTKSLVALSPGCNDIGRTWPIDRYAELAKRLSENGHAILVMGGPDEKQLARTIQTAVGDKPFFDFTGTDLFDAALQAACADLLVANDSGLLHLGAATGTPSIAIYGGSAHERTGPKNDQVHSLSPAGAPWKPGQPSRIREISTDQVYELAVKLLG